MLLSNGTRRFSRTVTCDNGSFGNKPSFPCQPQQKRSIEWEQRVLSSLNLAALQQANKRRRASVARSPPLPCPPSPSGGNEPREARKTVQTLLEETEMAAGKTPAEASRPVVGGDNIAVLGGTDKRSQESGGEGRPSASPTTGEASSVPPAAISPPSCGAEGSGRDGAEESGLGDDGAASYGDGGGGDSYGDRGTCAANLARNGGATFVLVAKEHLVGTWLAVFVRASMLQEVSDVRTGNFPDQRPPR